MHDNAPFAGNLFWQAPEDHGLPGGVDAGVKQPMDEDMTPLDVDDAALNACVNRLFLLVFPNMGAGIMTKSILSSLSCRIQRTVCWN